MFGTFTWEKRGDNNGDIIWRPIFLIADSFVKSHGVKRKRLLIAPETANNEVVNFSVLSIKFSNNLTKEMIFTGIRDIVNKIGDYVTRGYQFQLDFTFGTMASKEKRIKFEFDYSKIGKVG